MSKPILKKEFNLSRVEAIKYQLHSAINRPDTVMNETLLFVLTYVYIYGSRVGKANLITHGVLTNRNTVSNYFTMLKEMGYLIHEDECFKLNPKIKLIEGDFVELTVINVDTENYDIRHPYYKREAASASPRPS